MIDTEDYQSPAEALKTLQATQNKLADNFSRDSWSYDIIYSVLTAGIVASSALPIGGNFVIIAGCTLCLVVLAKAWANKHGFWVSGTTPKTARWVAIFMGMALAGLVATGALFSYEHAQPLVPLYLAGVAFVIALIGSRLWRSLYRRDLGLPA